jgi:hypothetical protein
LQSRRIIYLSRQFNTQNSPDLSSPLAAAAATIQHALSRALQAPLPELQHLRCGASHAAPRLVVGDGLPGRLPLLAVSGVHLDLAATFWPPGLEGGSGANSAAGCVAGPARARRCGLFLRSWRPGGEGAAAVVFDWETRMLQVRHWQGPVHGALACWWAAACWHSLGEREPGMQCRVHGALAACWGRGLTAGQHMAGVVHAPRTR